LKDSAQRYSGTVRYLRTAIREKHPDVFPRGVIVFHDDTRPHVACTAQDTLRSTRWKVLDIPDVSLSDFHVFGPLKKKR
jgi:hypothetical protein